MAKIAEWLAGLGLEKYAATFAAQEIDFDLLCRLTEDDIRELGLPIGPRRKLLDALGALRRAAMSERRDTAERRQLTVMFVDLASSTSLSVRLDPEAMREVLRAYHDAVAAEITAAGGHVAKLMGDGVLAYFGWPQAHEDDAERAARAGLAIAAAVSRLPSPPAEPLACRVGIATGLVVVGDLIGEGASQEHAVVGVTPNLAARLQEAAEPGSVVTAAATRRLLGPGFFVEALGERPLKGHDEPVPLFRVLREETREARFAAPADAVLHPIVGREIELGILLRLWSRTKSGAGQAVLLAGEAGIGKSRLLRAFAEAVATDQPGRQFYQCSPSHSGNPLWPVAQQLSRAAAIVAGDDGAARRAKLEQYLRTRVDDPRSAAALLAPLLGAPEGSEGPDSRAHRQRRQATAKILIEQLLAIGDGRPALVVFEDLQWADTATIDLLRGAIGAIRNTPILLIVTTRGEGEQRLGGLPDLQRVALARLDRPAAAAMIAGIAESRPLPARLAGEILVRSDGIPLFVEEMTKAVIEAAPVAAGAVAVPATLRDALIARLDVSPAVKGTAQIAACIGRDFDAPLLEAVADIPRDELDAGLAALLTAGLVVAEAGGGYSFRHALLRDIAYEALLTPRRQKLHRRIAEAIEAVSGDRPQSEPELLARHWFAAGEHARAEMYWLRARHRAAHWQEQFDALADYLDDIEAGEPNLLTDATPVSKLH